MNTDIYCLLFNLPHATCDQLSIAHRLYHFLLATDSWILDSSLSWNHNGIVGTNFDILAEILALDNILVVDSNDGFLALITPEQKPDLSSTSILIIWHLFSWFQEAPRTIPSALRWS